MVLIIHQIKFAVYVETSEMPRRARLVMDGGTYHVLTRGNNGQMLFQDDRDYQRYMDLLLPLVREHGVKVFHFVLMPTEVHMLMEVPLAEALSKLMSGINLAYSWGYRKRYGYSGHLWQGRFLSLMIDPPGGLLACGRYVELNPVRTGVVMHPKAYRWSSYHTYAEGTPHPLLSSHPHYPALGSTARERQARYRQFIQEGTIYPTIPPAAKMLPVGFPILRRSLGRPRKLEALLQKPTF